MQDVAADKAKKTAQNATAQKTDDAARLSTERPALDRRYGQIGISAVAAAVRYQGATKNPAYAPVAIKWQERAEEAA